MLQARIADLIGQAERLDASAGAGWPAVAPGGAHAGAPGGAPAPERLDRAHR